MKRALCLLLLACGPHEVELVGFMGDRPPPPSRVCSSNSDCTGDEFCEKFACDEAQGRCARRDMCMPMPGRPVCGCDGKTYDDNCTRKAAGVASFDPGPCM